MDGWIGDKGTTVFITRAAPAGEIVSDLESKSGSRTRFRGCRWFDRSRSRPGFWIANACKKFAEACN